MNSKDTETTGDHLFTCSCVKWTRGSYADNVGIMLLLRSIISLHIPVYMDPILSKVNLHLCAKKLGKWVLHDIALI